MQATKFVALTGHLNDYPLADLIGILRRQRKTGRLLIEYPISPCSFFFADGDLVDAQLNNMGGLQAVLVALSQPNAAFNFNPLIQPPRRTINESSQKVILELLGCWDEKPIDVEATPRNGGGARAAIPEAEVVVPAAPEQEALPAARQVLALPPAQAEQAARKRNRQVLIISAVISLLVSLITVVALARWLIRRDIASALSETNRRNSWAGAGGGTAAATTAQTVKVTVRVEGGRVTQAFVQEHRQGMEVYEALALRFARSRRYAAGASGQETVEITINAPE